MSSNEIRKFMRVVEGVDETIEARFDKLVGSIKQNIGVTVPRLLALEDYHEVGALNDTFKQLGMAVHAIEAGFNQDTGRYYALVVADGTKNKHSLLQYAERVINAE